MEDRDFLSVPEWGAHFGWNRSQSYEHARRLGVAIRISERRLVVPRRALDVMAEPALERLRQNTSGDFVD